MPSRVGWSTTEINRCVAEARHLEQTKEINMAVYSSVRKCSVSRRMDKKKRLLKVYMGKGESEGGGVY